MYLIIRQRKSRISFVNVKQTFKRKISPYFKYIFANVLKTRNLYAQ